MITLGINAAYHDSSAALVRDGQVVAAAEEERFTRIKHGKRPVPFSAWELPFHAIDHCLAAAGIRLADVDHVAYAYDPRLYAGSRAVGDTITLPLQPSASGPGGDWLSPWDPLFLAYVTNAPRQLASGAPHHLRARFEGVRHDGPFRWHWIEHHLAHEASAFLAAPFNRCAVLTLDGRGEVASGSHGLWHGDRYERMGQVGLPHSLGLLYEDVTRHLGFLHSSDEYKVMALAAFGRPTLLDEFRASVRLSDTGAYQIDTERILALAGPPRRRGEPIEPRHADLAASLQQALEEAVLGIARWLRDATGASSLAMAGGVALNCVLNARLRDAGLYDAVWVQPAAGDAGTALGAALWTDWRERGGGPRAWSMTHAYLGPSWSDDEIERFLDWARVPWQRLDDVAAETAAMLAAGDVIGWFQGPMEFGPRALGARSILASPTDPGMQARLNELKDREDFRPVAPAVLESAFGDWFTGAQANGGRAPFMLFVHGVRPDRADRIAAVRHVDGTARVQTVASEHNPRYHDLIEAFGHLTGIPVLVNTSFNVRGEPIVCTPRDALESFASTPLDALVIGRALVRKRLPS